MTLSAAFLVEGVANPAPHHVAYGSTVNLELTSTDGATSIVWEIMGCSEPSEPIPVITPAGNPHGRVASFVFPADSGDTLGRTFVVRCTVSNQVLGVDGVLQTAIEYAVIGAENSQGELPIVPGEKNYRHGTHGWAPEINRALNNSGGGGGGGGGGWTDDGSIVRLTSSSDSVAIGTTTLSGTEKLRVLGSARIEQVAAAAGAPKAFYVSGAAHTALSAGAEIVDVDLALDRTVQHATGAVATQRAFVVRAPSYSFVGSSTITDAATFAITGAPSAGTNATLTNSYALWVQAGAVRLGALTAGVVVSSATGVLSSLTGSALQVLRWNSAGTALEFANPGSSLSAPSNPADDGKVAVAAAGDLTYTLLSDVHIASSAAISHSKLAPVATDRLLGRDTAGTGAIEELTVSGGLEFTGAGGIQRSALTGDITAAAGSGVTAITAGVIVDADVNASAAIAFSKLATIATDSLLGRDTAGTGALETIGLNATLSMTGAGALQRAALTGDVTAAAGSNTTAIAAGVIVDADVNAAAGIAITKLGNIATDTLMGRDTAGTGAIEAITLAGGLEFTGSTSIQRSAISGDITIAAGSGTSAITAGVIVDADINASAAIAFTKLATLAGLSVLGRDVGTTGAVAAITGTEGQVLRIASGVLDFGTIDIASVTGDIPISQLADITALSVLANAANATAAVTAVPASVDGQVFLRSGTTLVFGTVATAGITNSAVTYAKIQNVSVTDRLLGRDTTGAGVVEELTVSGGVEFTGAGGIQRSAISGDITIAAGSGTAAITAGVIVDADINASAAIAFTKLATIATDRLLGRDTAGTGTLEELTVTGGLEFTGAGGIQRSAISGDITIPAGSGTAAISPAVIVNADISAAASISLSKLQNVSTAVLLGRVSSGTGGIEFLDVTGGLEFNTTGIQRAALTGDVTASAGSNVTAIAAGVIVNADINASAAIALSKLATQAALTVVANGTNAVAVPTAIAAGSDGQVFLRSGTTLTFGTITAAGITNGTITLTKLAAGSDAGNMIYWNGSAWTETTTFETDGNSIAFGTDPAGAGAVRLSAGDSVAIKLSGGNSVLALSQSSNTLVYGANDPALTSTQFSVGTGGQFSLAIAGSGEYVFNSSTFDGQLNTLTNWTSGAFSSYVAVGATPAGAGAIRLSNGDQINWEASPAGSDIGIIVDASEEMTVGYNSVAVRLNVGGSTRVRIDSTTADFTNSNIVTTSYLSVGNTPSTQGHIRIPNGAGAADGIWFRNGGDNMPGLAFNAGTLVLGNSADDGYTITTAGLHTLLAGGTTIASFSSATSTILNGATTMLQIADLSGRKVMSLFSAVTATEMPANTGAEVLYWSDAATLPTTGFPTSGGVMAVSSTGGLQWKGKNGVETTIAPHGDSGNTTKRRMVGVKTQPLRSTFTVAGVNTLATFDVASVNGAAITTGVIKAICHFIVRGSSGTYTSCGHVMACIDVIAGTPTVIVTVAETEAGSASALGAFSVNVSGTTVRCQSTPHVLDYPYQVFAYWELDEFEP